MIANDPLSPFEPGKDGPWDRRAAAHLLRRAGFGARPADVDRAVRDGLSASVENLFAEAPEQEAEFAETFGRLAGHFLDFGDPPQLQAWWLYRMVHTRTPLREKLTLFWHSHFTTSFRKVDDLDLLLRQWDLLRKSAWGNFGELLTAIAHDPAMLVYLDNESNSKENPNENFGRELLECFTLGRGNFTETDVRTAARAFTGWGRDGEKFAFDAEQHDAGPKGFLGQKGNFDGGDILNILLKQPALAKHIARKLLVFFACPEPPAEVVTAAASAFTQAHRDIKTFLRTLFLSKFFFSPACRRTRIASPTEFVIGSCRTLGARVLAADLRQAVVDMGQELFAPPSVAGWDGEQAWLNTATWAARLAFAQRIGDLPTDNAIGPRADIAALVPADLADPTKVLDHLAEMLLDGALSMEQRAQLVEYLVSTDEGAKAEQFAADAEFRKQQIKATVGVMLGMPEYQAY